MRRLPIHFPEPLTPQQCAVLVVNALEKQRRARRAPMLAAKFPSLTVWSWPHQDPARWNAYHSLDGGATFVLDDFVSGNERQFAPDGGQYPMFIVGVDASGKEITARSNVVIPDSALYPAPVLAATYPSLATWSWGYTNPAFWAAYHSLDGGQTFVLDDYTAGANRQFAPDGGQYPMFIVGVDATLKEVTERSNFVVPDSAAAPIPAAEHVWPLAVDGYATAGTVDLEDAGFGVTGFAGGALEVAYGMYANAMGPDISTTPNYSISLWFQPTAVTLPEGAGGHGLYQVGEGYDYLAVAIEGGMADTYGACFWSAVQALTCPFTAYAFAVDAWYHFVMAYDRAAEQAKFYLNGELVLTWSCAAAYSEPMGHVWVGSNCYTGLLNDFRIFTTTTLSPAAVAARYAAGRNP